MWISHHSIHGWWWVGGHHFWGPRLIAVGSICRCLRWAMAKPQSKNRQPSAGWQWMGVSNGYVHDMLTIVAFGQSNCLGIIMTIGHPIGNWWHQAVQVLWHAATTSCWNGTKIDGDCVWWWDTVLNQEEASDDLLPRRLRIAQLTGSILVFLYTDRFIMIMWWNAKLIMMKYHE